MVSNQTGNHLLQQVRDTPMVPDTDPQLPPSASLFLFGLQHPTKEKLILGDAFPYV